MRRAQLGNAGTAIAFAIRLPYMQAIKRIAANNSRLKRIPEMAATQTNRPVAAGALNGGRVSAVFTAAFAALSTWNDARITRHALGKLSDRELDDIGLCRGDIDRMTADRS